MRQYCRAHYAVQKKRGNLYAFPEQCIFHYKIERKGAACRDWETRFSAFPFTRNMSTFSSKYDSVNGVAEHCFTQALSPKWIPPKITMNNAVYIFCLCQVAGTAYKSAISCNVIPILWYFWGVVTFIIHIASLVPVASVFNEIAYGSRSQALYVLRGERFQ